MYDIAIIGAGIAGLTSAIYARRANKKVLVIEAKTYGGQIINTLKIQNYPAMPGVSGPDLAKKTYDQAVALGAEFEFATVTEVKKSDKTFQIKTDDGTYEAKSIIIATGTEEQKLGLPREEALTGRGISYCATCDGALYKNKPVAVVGGGNTALYDALYLSDIASKIYLVHRRDEFRGDAYLVDKLREKSHVDFVMSHVASGIIGEEKVEALIVKNSEGEERTLEVSAIFVAVGKIPSTKPFENLVELNEKGYIVAGEDCKTSAEGIFVAGDCRTKNLRQLVTATADGAIAADAAVNYLD